VSRVGPAEGLQSYHWRPSYESSDGDLIDSFYLPALERSVDYRRAVGYFKSSIFSLTSRGIARFALDGGRMRVICSPEISREDHQAIHDSDSFAEISRVAARRDLEAVRGGESAEKQIEVFAALIAFGSLEVRFAISKHGLFHDKFGVFTDENGDSVSFRGSSNESWSAWSPLGNQEGFEVFTSWDQDFRRVVSHIESFQEIWNSDRRGIETMSMTAAVMQGILGLMPASLDEAEAILREKDLEDVQEESATPSISDINPSAVPLRPLRSHQRDVLDDWHRKNKRGIVAHATGSGKTVTAIAAAREWLESDGTVLIVVPSRLLLAQWRVEINTYLADLQFTLVTAGGGYDEWRKSGLLRIASREDSGAAIILATFATASKEDFRSSLRDGNHMMCIADEVHGLGAKSYEDLLLTTFGAHLGLSATPDRYGDDEGTQRVRAAFGENLEPAFGIAEALEEGALSPYLYYPTFVHLDEEEREEWTAVTAQISQLLQRKAEGGLDSDLELRLQREFIKRARIAKKARAKLPVSLGIVRDNFEEDQSWLVYAEDQEQVAQILENLRGAGVDNLYEYHSAMTGDSEATMEAFRRRHGVMVAIRCLDEGVDIPEVSHAVILASSRNPREFIQRRGRVLRKSEGKYVATIFDVLVAPPERGTSEGFALAELSRAMEFARFAENSDALLAVEAIADEWNIEQEALEAASGYGEEERVAGVINKTIDAGS
jgi:superfamily II DNA or RNA helicase